MNAEYQRQKRAANRDHYRALQRKYAKRNRHRWKKPDPEKRRAIMRRWRENNREHVRKYYRNRLKTNEQSRLRNQIAARVYKVLSRVRTYKNNSTLNLLGISLDGLKLHLESLFLPGMGWHNRSEWHIDHKRPCASFDLTDSEQQKQCFHYTNLQPLWWRDNLSKAAKV